MLKSAKQCVSGGGLCQPTQAGIVFNNVVCSELVQIDGTSIAAKEDGLERFGA